MNRGRKPKTVVEWNPTTANTILNIVIPFADWQEVKYGNRKVIYHPINNYIDRLIREKRIAGVALRKKEGAADVPAIFEVKNVRREFGNGEMGTKPGVQYVRIVLGDEVA
jgi:hypothetical protein